MWRLGTRICREVRSCWEGNLFPSASTDLSSADSSDLQHATYMSLACKQQRLSQCVPSSIFERNFPNKPPPPSPPSMDPCVKPAALYEEQSQVLTEASPWTLRVRAGKVEAPRQSAWGGPGAVELRWNDAEWKKLPEDTTTTSTTTPPLLLLLPRLLPPDPRANTHLPARGLKPNTPPLHLCKSQPLYESPHASDPAVTGFKPDASRLHSGKKFSAAAPRPLSSRAARWMSPVNMAERERYIYVINTRSQPEDA